MDIQKPTWELKLEKYVELGEIDERLENKLAIDEIKNDEDFQRLYNSWLDLTHSTILAQHFAVESIRAAVEILTYRKKVIE